MRNAYPKAGDLLKKTSLVPRFTVSPDVPVEAQDATVTEVQ